MILEGIPQDLQCIPECQICTLVYATDQPQRRPHILQCGHSFCQSCVESIPRPKKCPVCKAFHFSTHISVNYALEEMVKGATDVDETNKILMRRIQTLEKILDGELPASVLSEGTLAKNPAIKIQKYLPNLSSQQYNFSKEDDIFVGQKGNRTLREAAQYNYLDRSKAFLKKLKRTFEEDNSSEQLDECYLEASQNLDFLEKFTKRFPRPDRLKSEAALAVGKPIIREQGQYLGKRE